MKSLVTALMLASAIARAQAPEEPHPTSLPDDGTLMETLADPTMTSERAYSIGARLFAAARYEAAERAWLRAYALSKDPALLVAVADTRERRGDEAGAEEMLRQYLEVSPNAPDRLAIEARIAELLRRPATLVVRTAPPGRAILLDGAPIEQRTPARLEVAPGLHTVVVMGEGESAGRKTVVVAYGEVKELDFAPEAPTQIPVEQVSDQARLAETKERLAVRRAVISTGSIAAAALVPGTVLRVLAVRENDRAAEDPTVQTTRKSDRLATFSNVSFGLAALSAITSFALFMTHKNRRGANRESARLSLDAHCGGASATLRF